jgi:hypothetical protein
MVAISTKMVTIAAAAVAYLEWPIMGTTLVAEEEEVRIVTWF